MFVDVFLETGLHNSSFWLLVVFSNGLYLAQREVSLAMTVFKCEYKDSYLACN